MCSIRRNDAEEKYNDRSLSAAAVGYSVEVNPGVLTSDLASHAIRVEKKKNRDLPHAWSKHESLTDSYLSSATLSNRKKTPGVFLLHFHL